jgi:hypothetical protein
MNIRSEEEIKIEKLFTWLNGEGYTPDDCHFKKEDYHYFRKNLLKKISIPDTTITPIMERFLYFIGSSKSIENIVVFGSYYGYALLWLLGGGIHNNNRKVSGIDIDFKACEGAKKNIEGINDFFSVGNKCSIYNENALKSLESFQDHSIDLCLLDIDVNGSKKEYIELLNIWENKLKPNCIILAHDPMVEKFHNDFHLFHNFIKTNDLYSSYITLPLDFCGIDIFKKRT